MTNYIMCKLAKRDVIDKQVANMDDAQIELSLLSKCLGFGKLMHMLGTCPPELITDAISSFDARWRISPANRFSPRTSGHTPTCQSA